MSLADCSNILPSNTEYYTVQDEAYPSEFWGGRNYTLLPITPGSNNDAVVDITPYNTEWNSFYGYGILLENPGQLPDGYFLNIVTESTERTSLFFTDNNGINRPVLHQQITSENSNHLQGLVEATECTGVPKHSLVVLRRPLDNPNNYYWEWVKTSWNNTGYPTLSPLIPPPVEGAYKQWFINYTLSGWSTQVNAPDRGIYGRLFTVDPQYHSADALSMSLPEGSSHNANSDYGSRYRIFANNPGGMHLTNWSYSRFNIPVVMLLSPGDQIECVCFDAESSNQRWAVFTMGEVT